ncbi:MAG: hypothetical protein GXY83_12705 [Rhodopirellula sp.]|nr:hypothetical protein [Rhodopirellula sp.]
MKARIVFSACMVGLLAAQQAMAQQGYDIRSVGYAGEEKTAAPAAPAGECSTCTGGEVCTDGTCDTGIACVDPCYQPRWTFFGDVLYLRARDVEVPYAVQNDGTETVNQVGRVALVDPDYDLGFRIGGSFMLDCDAALAMQYTWWRADTEDSFTVDQPGAIGRWLVSHPGTLNVDSGDLDATAEYDIEFQLVDVDYRSNFYCNGRTSLTWLAGVSYGHLEETFASQLFGNQNGSFVDTNIKFDGGGIRLGLEAERYARDCGLLVYGRGSARFLAGEFDADYIQGEIPGDPVQINTGWKAGRVVSILDLELGAGWQNCNGTFRVTGGYMVSGWFNTVTTADWISAVHNNNYNDLGDTITFDGFVARAELRY